MSDPSPHLQGLPGAAASLIVLAGVAALARGMVVVMLSNPLPWEKKRELYAQYGKWAVELAEARCPRGRGMVECVEREARILVETRLRR